MTITKEYYVKLKIVVVGPNFEFEYLLPNLTGIILNALYILFLADPK